MAITTVEDVVVVITMEVVVAVAAVDGVVTGAAGQQVLTGLTGESVVAIAAVGGVVAVAADEPIDPVAAVEVVVAALTAQFVVAAVAVEEVVTTLAGEDVAVGVADHPVREVRTDVGVWCEAEARHCVAAREVSGLVGLRDVGTLRVLFELQGGGAGRQIEVDALTRVERSYRDRIRRCRSVRAVRKPDHSALMARAGSGRRKLRT